MSDEFEDVQEIDPSVEIAREETQRDMLVVLDELRADEPTGEEKRVLDDFERFRQQHPFDLKSLTDIDIE